jgi:hypothetical protein
MVGGHASKHAPEIGFYHTIASRLFVCSGGRFQPRAMRTIALFTDATVHPPSRRAAIGVACFDVTRATEPKTVFRLSQPIPFCDCTMAEKLAALRGVERVLALVRDGQVLAQPLLVFIDSKTVTRSAQIVRSAAVSSLESLGVSVTFHHVPRCLNRAAHREAHDALYPPHPDLLAPPEIPACHATLIARFPFLPLVNA